MNNNYQLGGGAYPAYNQNYNLSYNTGYAQNATNIGITGAAVGAVAGAAKGLCNNKSGDKGRAVNVVKTAACDAAICGTSSFAGALASGALGARGWLSFAVFAAAGIGTGYALHKVLSKKCGSVCEDDAGVE